MVFLYLSDNILSVKILLTTDYFTICRLIILFFLLYFTDNSQFTSVGCGTTNQLFSSGRGEQDINSPDKCIAVCQSWLADSSTGIPTTIYAGLKVNPQTVRKTTDH